MQASQELPACHHHDRSIDINARPHYHVDRVVDFNYRLNVDASRDDIHLDEPCVDDDCARDDKFYVGPCRDDPLASARGNDT